MGACVGRQNYKSKQIPSPISSQSRNFPEYHHTQLKEPKTTTIELGTPITSTIVYGFCRRSGKENTIIPQGIIKIITLYGANVIHPTLNILRESAVQIDYKLKRYSSEGSIHFEYTFNALKDNKDKNKHNTKNFLFIIDGFISQNTKPLNIPTESFNLIQQLIRAYCTEKTKILFLGAGLVGKSTIFKQIAYCYGQDISKEQSMQYKQHLGQNIIEATRTVAIYSELLGDSKYFIDQDNIDIRNEVARMTDRQEFTQEHCNKFKILWNDEGIKRTARMNHKYVLACTYKYLVKNMDKYCNNDGITFDDVLAARQRTTAVNKCTYFGKRSFVKYEVFDTGGEPNERRKWKYFFHDAHVVVYVANLYGYNRKLWHNNRKNALMEDINLFSKVINVEQFRKNTHIILVLNKLDLFMEEFIELGLEGVNEELRDVVGDVDNAPEFITIILNRFLGSVKHNKYVHCFLTNALDTKGMESVIEFMETIYSK